MKHNKKRNTAATTSIDEVDRYVAQFDETSIDTTPGDVLVLNGLTLHRSQHNHSDRTRWSLQLRYLNFLDETGRRIGWRSGMITNADVSDVHPGAVIIDEPEEQPV